VGSFKIFQFVRLVALGNVAAGVFTLDDQLFLDMRQAGIWEKKVDHKFLGEDAGELVWRLPLFPQVRSASSIL
jgi:leucyl aminopeptidase